MTAALRVAAEYAPLGVAAMEACRTDPLTTLELPAGLSLYPCAAYFDGELRCLIAAGDLVEAIAELEASR